jgi:hypothetical protein
MAAIRGTPTGLVCAATLAAMRAPNRQYSLKHPPVSVSLLTPIEVRGCTCVSGARYLSSFTIGDVGAVAFAAMIRENSVMEKFHIEKNKIGDAGLGAIAEALKANTALTTVDLWFPTYWFWPSAVWIA